MDRRINIYNFNVFQVRKDTSELSFQKSAYSLTSRIAKWFQSTNPITNILFTLW